MIEVRDLVYEYPAKRALEGVSLSVAAANHHSTCRPERRGQNHAFALSGGA